MTEPDTSPAQEIPPQHWLRNAVFWLAVVSSSAVAFSVAISSVTMGLAIGLWLIGLLWSRGRSFTPTPLDLLFLAYAVAELAVACFSPEPMHALVNAKRLFLFSFVYLLSYAVSDRKKLALVVGIFVAVTAVISFVEFFSLSLARGHFQRLSLFQMVLTEGGIKMIALLLALPFLFDRRLTGKWRWLTLLSVIFLFIGLVLTQTRSSWLGLVGGLITLGFVKDRKILIALVVLIIVFLLVAPADFRSRAATIFDPAKTSNLTRIHMVETGWKMFMDHPLAGYGDIDLRKYYIAYIVPLDDAEGGHLHNNVMMLLVTLGIAGFSAVMALFIRIGGMMLSAIRKTRDLLLEGNVAIGCFSAYIGFHINGLFEWNYGDHEIAVLLWTTVGLSLVILRSASMPGWERHS